MSENVFDKLKEGIAKNVKGVHASVMADSEITGERFWVKTPSYDLNRILSGSLFNGIQSRNLVGITGPEHTMKSSFMVLCMVEAQKQGCKPVIIDTEGGITTEFCERWGLDASNILYVYTPWISEVKSVLAQIKDTADDRFIIGLDSAGGLDRMKSFTDALGGDPKADQGLLQKEIRGTLKLLLNICIAQNSIGIVCGHMYGRPGSIPMPDQIGGGKAMRLFPSILINLKKKPLMEDKKVIGNEILATTIKNRSYPPFQEATIHLDYKDGMRPCAGLIDLGEKMNIITKAGSWYSYGDVKLGQGAINASKSLENLPELLKEMDEWLKDTGYSTVSKEIEEAEALLEGPDGEAEVKKVIKKVTRSKKK